MTGATLTLHPPSRDLFAAVQVEACDHRGDWRVVGAQPAYVLDDDGNMLPADPVRVDCKAVKPGEKLRYLWVHENSGRGVAVVEPGAAKPRGRGALG